LKKNIFKPVFLLALSFIILLGGIQIHMTQSAEASSNSLVLENPGFEEPVQDGVIPGWTQTFGTTGFTVDETVAFSGSNSLKLEDDSDTGSIGIQSNKVAITGGKTYKASAKLKLLEGEVFIYMYYYDRDGNQIAAARQTAYSPNEWVSLTVVSTAPVEAAQAAVLFYSGVSPVSTAYLDDVTLGLTFGGPEDLGEIVGTVISQGVAFGTNGQGENELYFATNGKPATFYAVDAETMQVKFSQPLPGLDVVWAITVGSDGNVYFSGTTNRRIYRYLPDTKEIQNVADNRTYNPWIWDMEASKDGKIYGSTYPHARVFEFDIETGASKIWARDLTAEKYARGLGVTDDHVYVGIGTKAYLYKIDRETKEVSEVIVPNRGNPGTSISKAWVYNGKILARSGGSRLFVIDEATHEIIRGANEDYINFQYSISSPSPLNSDLIYYKYEESLYTYNLATNEISKIENEAALPMTAMRGFNWMTLQTGAKAGTTVLTGLTEFGEYIIYDPQDNSLEVTYPQVQPQGVLIQSLESGPNGNLYVGGYQGGMSIYDPLKDEVIYNQPQFNQSEGIGFLDELAFFGTYSSARMFQYDITKPTDFGHNATNNPGLAFKIGEEQDRPFAITSGDNKVFIGTVPYYGIVGGALTVYDRNDDTWTVHRNVVQGQSIIGLAYHEGKLYGSTSVYGGLGSTPTAEEAKIFVWDVATGQKIREITPEIPGIDATPKAIGDLSFGPDGKLWGAAQGTIFAMDPETLQVEKARTIYPSDWNVTHYWRPIFLRWGPDGMLYTTLDRKLTVVDPETLDSFILDVTSLMTIGEDGNLYYSKGSHLYRIALPNAGKQAVSLNTQAQNDGFSLTLTAQDAENIKGGKLILSFDSAKFEVSDVTPGSLLSDRRITFDKGKDDKFIINIVPNQKGSLMNGDGDVLKVQFKLREDAELPSNTNVVLSEETYFVAEETNEKIPVLWPITRWIGF
jgi:hypothetical protein